MLQMKKFALDEQKLYNRAVDFATKAHEGAVRKGTNIPYITHPLETAEIVMDMTDNMSVIVAALLHDVAEDTNYTIEDIRNEFGQEVADMVAKETEDKRRDLPPEQTWKIRKQEFLDYLQDATLEGKMIAIGDKLSNIRSMVKDYKELKDAMWNKFNQKDKTEHAWYYKNVADLTKELEGFEPWQEYNRLCKELFGE